MIPNLNFYFFFLLIQDFFFKYTFRTKYCKSPESTKILHCLQMLQRHTTDKNFLTNIQKNFTSTLLGFTVKIRIYSTVTFRSTSAANCHPLRLKYPRPKAHTILQLLPKNLRTGFESSKLRPMVSIDWNRRMKMPRRPVAYLENWRRFNTLTSNNSNTSSSTVASHLKKKINLKKNKKNSAHLRIENARANSHTKSDTELHLVHVLKMQFFTIFFPRRRTQ